MFGTYRISNYFFKIRNHGHLLEEFVSQFSDVQYTSICIHKIYYLHDWFIVLLNFHFIDINLDHDQIECTFIIIISCY